MNGFSKSKREAVFLKSNGKCALCGKELQNDPSKYTEGDYMQVDHIKPKSQGGKNDIDNLRALCRPCNSGRCNFSGEPLKNTILKAFDDSNLIIQGKRLEKVLDDIKNGLLTEKDIDDIYTKIEKTFYDNSKALRHMYNALWNRKED